MKTFKDFLNKKAKTVEQLAAKHNISVDEIQKQLEMGMKVEKEHTSHEDVARQIALNHLDELPDYYTQLQSIEKKK